MSTVAERLFQEAMALSEAERVELAEALLATQSTSSDLPFDPVWLNEIQRRSDEIDAGAVECAPWSVVRDRVRQRVQGTSRG